LNDKLVTAGDDALAVAASLLEHMEPDSCEIVTIYYGQDVSASDAAHLAETVRTAYDHLEVEVLDGGQPYYYYIISAE
jgi:dihydroxyacetone kinase-like predicted kinase